MPNGQVRLDTKNVCFQKSHNGPEQFEQNNHQEEIVHQRDCAQQKGTPIG